jgi:DNA modification methylase
MVGGGTTLVECKLTGRHGIGVDVNTAALMVAMDRLNFELPSLPAPGVEETEAPPPLPEGEGEGAGGGDSARPSTGSGRAESVMAPAITLYHGDARNLDRIPDDSIDLIATHPPYANIIRYSKPARSQKEAVHPEPVEGRADAIPDDLSNVRGIAEYTEQMRPVAAEALRVLKPDHYCGILVGDTRRSRHYTPIAFRVLQAFLEAGFILKEDVIKAQWHTQTEGLWARMSRDKNFLLIMHEHLFIFRKPAPGEDARPYRESMRWW